MKSSSILTSVSVALGLGGTTIVSAASVFAEAELERSADIIATHIRNQGFTCGKALAAERDATASRPNEDVWTLTCDNARYRVRLIPDMAARVERLLDGTDSKETRP